MGIPKSKIFFVSATLFSVFAFERMSQAPKVLPPDISFLIADLKWNNGTLKILELGEGLQSYFQGFDELFGDGKIWQLFWQHINQFKLPIWYIGKQPKTPKKIKQFAFNKFLSNGGNVAKSLETLQDDTFFKKTIADQKSIKHPASIKQYRGILIFSNHGSPNWYAQSLLSFKKKYPDFLVINDASTHYVNHKYRTSLLFNNGLQTYRPQWIRCYKKYYPELSDTIRQNINSPIVVIKPLNSANGWGTIIIGAQELDVTLKKILTQKELLKNCDDKSWSYWENDQNYHFLIEEFVQSHPCIIKDKNFDGTMRVVFILTYEHESIDIIYLGSCWKLPKLSINQPGTLMEKHKSGYGAAQVDHDDTKQIESILNNLLPQLYKKMLQKKMH